MNRPISLSFPAHALRGLAGIRAYIRTVISEVAHVDLGSKPSRIVRRIAERIRLERYLGLHIVSLALLTSLVIPEVSVLATGSEDSQPAASYASSVLSVETPIATIVNRRFPVETVKLTQGFHFFHRGVDLDGVIGDSIYPIASGHVESVGKEFFLGNTVRVSHENAYVSVYAHLSQILVSPGQEIDTSTKIGKMGNTGRSFGDHLHLEVYKDGKAVNPFTVFPR